MFRKRHFWIIALAVAFCFVSFTGCKKNMKESDWNMASDSLMSFPWGCDIERAEELLGISEADLFTTMGDPTSTGRNNLFQVYTLPEDYPVEVDYLQITYENYVDADGNEILIGVTDLTFGFYDRQEIDGEMVKVERTDEQQAYIESYYQEQISRCKDCYKAHFEQYGKSIDVDACGDWSKEKLSDLGYLEEYLEEYDFDTYQNQHPLITGKYTNSDIEFSGKFRAYLDAGLPKTDTTRK